MSPPLGAWRVSSVGVGMAVGGLVSEHDAGRAHGMIAGIQREAGIVREARAWTMTVELERMTGMRRDVPARVHDGHGR